jgi:hypothetical protein
MLRLNQLIILLLKQEILYKQISKLLILLRVHQKNQDLYQNQ